MSTRILAALLFSPLLFSCGDEGTISYKEKMPPAVPGNLEAVAGSQQITLTWDEVGSATSYTIFWNTVPTQAKYKDAEQEDQRVDGVTNPFVHTGLTAGQAYYYRVAAFNEGGVNYLPSKMEHDENDINNFFLYFIFFLI